MVDKATVIVALPPVDDRVNKISSEEKAHLTMLYLGDADLSAEAILYVQHACSELSPFYLTVDYRGTLGEDDADVLFFEKTAWDIKRVKEFLHYLLLNDEIKRAYDTTSQHPEWTPHITLGYPGAPAHEDDEDRRFYSVEFDRIAVWTGNFEGPEFRLKFDDYDYDMAMSTAEKGAYAAASIFSPDDLKQYGKKGMKWGVRNDKGHEGEKVKTKKLDKLDQQWEQDAMWKAHNAMADKMNNGMIDEHNNDPRWADVDLSKPENAALEETYMNEFFEKSDKVYMESLTELGVNPSGTKHYTMGTDEEGNIYAELSSVGEVKHAEGDTKTVIKLNRDDKGHITSATETELTLAHYGVKGMRWGVTTKDRAAQKTPNTEVTVTQKKAGRYAKSKGGKELPMSDDARAALEGRQKAKASTTDALSNAELQKVVTRMNLEQQYTNLSFQSDRRSKGARFAQGLLGKGRYGGKEKRKYSDNYENIGKAINQVYNERNAADDDAA